MPTAMFLGQVLNLVILFLFEAFPRKNGCIAPPWIQSWCAAIHRIKHIYMMKRKHHTGLWPAFLFATCMFHQSADLTEFFHLQTCWPGWLSCASSLPSDGRSDKHPGLDVYF